MPAFWLEEVRDYSLFVGGMRTDARRQARALCAYRSGILMMAMAVESGAADDSAIASRAMHIIGSTYAYSTERNVDVLADSSLTRFSVGHPRDSLNYVERLLGQRVATSTLIVIVKDSAGLAAVFPFAWADGRFGDYSLTDPNKGAVAFVAVRSGNWSVHEFVHVVLTSAVDPETMDPGYNYMAGEALARAIGGSNGRAFGELIGVLSPDVGAKLVETLMVSYTDSASGTVNGFDQLGIREIDVLGAAYRVALRSCARFPLSLLGAERVSGFRGVIASLARVTRLTQADVTRSIALELSENRLKSLPGRDAVTPERAACQR